MEKKKKHLTDFERGLTKKEVALEQKTEQAQKDAERVKLKETEIETRVQKLDGELKKNTEIQEELANKLTQVAGLTKDQAKAELIAAVEEEARLDSAKLVKRIEEEANEESEKCAKRIVGIAIQRFAGEYVAEQTISSVEIADDGVKGRLIGREGRNIRAFEQICGVDLIIDDTPGIVTISSFNVVRKEISRMTIERLIADGRIHPAKIEEFYEKCKHEFESRLRELGEKAQMEIGVHGIHPEILKLIGALNWRTSYTQNQYQHALESAFLAGNMAAELGLNVKQARRAGLMHDIGKVLDASPKAHMLLSERTLLRNTESRRISFTLFALTMMMRSQSQFLLTLWQLPMLFLELVLVLVKLLKSHMFLVSRILRKSLMALKVFIEVTLSQLDVKFVS